MFSETYRFLQNKIGLGFSDKILLINNMLYICLMWWVIFYFKSIVTLIDNHANTTLKNAGEGFTRRLTMV